MNVVHMFLNSDKKYLMMMHDNFLNWVKTRVLTVITLKTVTKFLWENIILRHKYFCKLIIDEDSKNKNVIMKLAAKYKIK